MININNIELYKYINFIYRDNMYNFMGDKKVKLYSTLIIDICEEEHE